MVPKIICGSWAQKGFRVYCASDSTLYSSTCIYVYNFLIVLLLIQFNFIYIFLECLSLAWINYNWERVRESLNQAGRDEIRKDKKTRPSVD